MGQDLGTQAKKLSERMDDLEKGVTALVKGLENRFLGINQQFTNTNETLQALVDLVGRDEIVKKVNETRLAKAQQEAANEKAALERGMAEGYVSAIDKVAERSIIVGCFVSADGTVDPPGRVQFPMVQVAESFKTQFLGSTVGAVIPAENGKSFKILEIYAVDEDKARALLAKTAESATAAGTAAKADEASDASGSSSADAQTPPPSPTTVSTPDTSTSA